MDAAERLAWLVLEVLLTCCMLLVLAVCSRAAAVTGPAGYPQCEE
jgi:hypothetical protein